VKWQSRRSSSNLEMNKKAESIIKLNHKRRFIGLLLILALIFALYGCNLSSLPALQTTTDLSLTSSAEPSLTTSSLTDTMIKEGYYSTPDDVAAYLHVYRQLPANYITKAEAANLGWDSSQGNLWEVTDHKSIGGDRFGNREGKLPQADGRQWFECDVNYQGGFRGAERLVYSDDGLIYYTTDHYQTFIKLY